MRAFAAFCGWCLLGLLLLEAGLRLTTSSPKSQFADPDLGVMRAPGRTVVHGTEGYSRSQSNALGHIDDAPRTSTTGRVLLVGDSYAEALQVPHEARYATKLEALTDREVLNAGQSGWSPINHVTYLETKQAELHPETVVVQVNDGDLDELFVTTGLHLTRDGDGWQVAGEQRSSGYLKMRGVMDAVSSRSALGYLLFSRASLLAGMQKARLTKKFSGQSAPKGKGAHKTIPARQREGLTWILGRLAEVRPDAVLLYIPALEYEVRGCANAHPDIRDLYHALAKRYGLRLVDPTLALCAAYEVSGQPQHGFHNGQMATGHLNAAGHTVVAEALAEALGGRRR